MWRGQQKAVGLQVPSDSRNLCLPCLHSTLPALYLRVTYLTLGAVGFSGEHAAPGNTEDHYGQTQHGGWGETPLTSLLSLVHTSESMDKSLAWCLNLCIPAGRIRLQCQTARHTLQGIGMSKCQITWTSVSSECTDPPGFVSLQKRNKPRTPSLDSWSFPNIVW